LNDFYGGLRDFYDGWSHEDPGVESSVRGLRGSYGRRDGSWQRWQG
jgi:hypothetical protein